MYNRNERRLFHFVSCFKFITIARKNNHQILFTLPLFSKYSNQNPLNPKTSHASNGGLHHPPNFEVPIPPPHPPLSLLKSLSKTFAQIKSPLFSSPLSFFSDFKHQKVKNPKLSGMSSNNISQSNVNSKHALALLLHLLFIELVSLRPAHAQNGTVLLAPPPTEQYNYSSQKFNPSLAIIMVVLVASFFLMGFFSVYVRRCTDRRRGYAGSPPTIGPFAFGRRSLRVTGHGLDPSVVESFPTFLYGSVKGHKINKAVSLECAVCLNEFDDDETLRLIPQCCHVFHPDCIDSWLSTHTTCPVCRADLTPKPGEVTLQIPVVGDIQSPEDQSLRGSHSQQQTCIDQDRQPDDKSHEEGSFKTTANQVAGEGGPRRSRSTGMRLARMFNYFPRSHSTGHSLGRAGEDRERFTLRLPEEVMRNQAIMSRTKSCVAFPRESSLRSGYRARSNRWAFTVAQLLGGLGRSRRGMELDVELGETSSDRQRPHPKGDNQR